MNNRKNASTFIYSILHPDEEVFIRGRLRGEERIKDYRGIEVDEKIPEKALDQLFSIDQIETRSSCQGHSEERSTFLIFRFKDKNLEEKVESIVGCLNKNEDIVSGYDLGSEGKIRVGVTTNMYYSPEREKIFNKWWESLASKILNCLCTST